MTARAQAAKAMADEANYYLFPKEPGHVTDAQMMRLVDAIPVDVLARLALERRAFEQTQVLLLDLGPNSKPEALYRLAED